MKIYDLILEMRLLSCGWDESRDLGKTSVLFKGTNQFILREKIQTVIRDWLTASSTLFMGLNINFFYHVMND